MDLRQWLYTEKALVDCSRSACENIQIDWENTLFWLYASGWRSFLAHQL